MSLGSLYQEIILDHNRNPRNYGLLKLDSTATPLSIHQENPSCGDQIDLQLNVVDGRIETIRFEGKGCAISQASASMMTEVVSGKSVDEALHALEAFQGMLFNKDYDADAIGDMEVLESVRKFPVRIRCATLCWHCLQQLLDGSAPSTPQ